MDKYYEVHGHDVSSFDISTTHRMPTVSAAAALADLEDDEATGFLPTGLPSLDRLLGNVDLDDSESHLSGGLLKGHLTEAWGPPGSGKTSLGIQLAVNTIEGGGRVTWVNAFHIMCQSRFDAVYQFAMRFQDPLRPRVAGLDTEETRASQRNTPNPNYHDRLDHFSCPSLAHFIALLCRPTPKCLAADTSLLVIDSLSALINHTYPRAPEAKRVTTPAIANSGRSSRRKHAVQYIVDSLQKLATTRNMAILILSQCATKLQAQAGATLAPSINTTLWEQGISTRIVLFRDWVWRGNTPTTAQFMGVQKLNGKPTTATNVVAFDISAEGLSEIPYDSSQPSIKMPTPQRKRKLEDTGFEIADSEDEEYGWDEDGDKGTLPSTLAPQWNGSEDIFLRPDGEEDPEHPVRDDHEIDKGAGDTATLPLHPGSSPQNGRTL